MQREFERARLAWPTHVGRRLIAAADERWWSETSRHSTAHKQKEKKKSTAYSSSSLFTPNGSSSIPSSSYCVVYCVVDSSWAKGTPSTLIRLYTPIKSEKISFFRQLDLKTLIYNTAAMVAYLCVSFLSFFSFPFLFYCFAFFLYFYFYGRHLVSCWAHSAARRTFGRFCVVPTPRAEQRENDDDKVHLLQGATSQTWATLTLCRIAQPARARGVFKNTESRWAIKTSGILFKLSSTHYSRNGIRTTYNMEPP